MPLTNDQLKTLLIAANFVTPEQFEIAEREAKARNMAVDAFLSESGLISDEHLGRVLANHYRLNFVDLNQEKIAKETLLVIPEVVAKAQRSLVFLEDENAVHLATYDPENYDFFNLLARKTGKEVKVYFATKRGVAEALQYYKTDTSGAIQRLIENLKTHFQEEDIVKLMDLLLEYAHDNRASDIHLEPLEGRTVVRFRIDGVLHDIIEYPPNIHEFLTARVKVLSLLRTDEHRRPQDGQLTFRAGGQRIDTRVSIVPVTDGERVVLRLLAERGRQFSLETIGLSEKDQQRVHRAIEKPWGMLLATGPTGCGKTTTLYAIFKLLNTREVNIATIEDPVEYDIEGVNQIQVDPQAGLTFATGLRSIVRQDPDIIMVGEIRDQETVEIAVNAALTGHLMLSTFHANNAVTTLVRLMEMGIEPYLVASTVNVVVAQRLVRKLCERCRESYTVSPDAFSSLIPPELQKSFSAKKILRLYRSPGCSVCSRTGFLGRTGIFEVLEMTDTLRNLIIQRSDAYALEEQAQKEGMKTMLEDGIEKVRLGITTLEEVIKTSSMS